MPLIHPENFTQIRVTKKHARKLGVLAWHNRRSSAKELEVILEKLTNHIKLDEDD